MWTKISEVKPSTEGKYLVVFCDDMETSGKADIEVGYWNPDCGCFGLDHGVLIEGVTHWAALPKLPKNHPLMDPKDYFEKVGVEFHG